MWPYLGSGPIVGETVRYVAEHEGEWVALLCWGGAALKSRHREEYVGWEERRKYERLHLVANNARFLVLPHVKVPHLASAVLSRNLRRLSADWEARYGHPIVLAETFVDLGRFRGTCYRAANWVYLGETRGMAKKGAGYEAHGRKKGLFVYPLHRRAREILSSPFLSPEILPRSTTPPVSVDVNTLPLLGEGGLVEALEEVEDPRMRRGVRHPVANVLALAVLAAFSGRRGSGGISEWAGTVPREFLLRLSGWRRDRPPSEPTFRRVLEAVDAVHVDEVVGKWLRALAARGRIPVRGAFDPSFSLLGWIRGDGAGPSGGEGESRGRAARSRG